MKRAEIYDKVCETFPELSPLPQTELTSVIEVMTKEQLVQLQDLLDVFIDLK